MSILYNNGFVRNDKTVKLSIDSGLETCKPIYPFEFECGSQETAEMLKNQMNQQLKELKKTIAKEAWRYLNTWGISELKKKLRGWNSTTERWK